MKNLMLFLLLLAACSPVAKPSATSSPTAIPTLTGTPVASPGAATKPMAGPTLTSTPVPRSSATTSPTDISTLTSTPVPRLVAHEWSQAKPLITFGDGWGWGTPWQFRSAFPVPFTLLPSGDLYLLRPIDDQRYTILTTTLSRQATCYLLNSIDQAGFFDYDPSSYGERGTPTDSGSTSISVQAWRANSVHLYAFSYYLSEEKQRQLLGMHPAVDRRILPAIRITYRLLDEYHVSPGDLHPLKPERLAVWIAAPWPRAGTNDYVEWPLTSHTIAAAGPVAGGPQQLHFPAMILTEEDATQVYDALGATFTMDGTLVREGDKLYQIFARPLLPNEVLGMGVWLYGPPTSVGTNGYIDWPLSSHPLAAAAPVEGYEAGPPGMILTGEDAVRVHNAVGENLITVREGDKLYQIYPMLLSADEIFTQSLPKVSLSCSPSDGWIQAP